MSKRLECSKLNGIEVMMQWDVSPVYIHKQLIQKDILWEFVGSVVPAGTVGSKPGTMLN